MFTNLMLLLDKPNVNVIYILIVLVNITAESTLIQQLNYNNDIVTRLTQLNYLLQELLVFL